MVYVVSMLRSTERRKAIAEQLSRFGVEFTFVDAVDASKVAFEWLRAQTDEEAVLRNIGRPLAGPEIGCALSHRLIYRDIVEGGHCGGLVLEDDAIISTHFRATLNYFREFGDLLKDTLAVYHLGALSTADPRDLVLKRRGARPINDEFIFAELIAWLSPETWGTFGYYITHKTAATMLASRRVHTIADHWSLWARRTGGQIFVSLPAIVCHSIEDDASAIEICRHNMRCTKEDKHRYVSWVRYLYYGVKARVRRLLVRPIAERIW